MIKNLSAFLGKSKFGMDIESVLVTPTHVVATDGFKLIEVAHDMQDRAQSVLVALPKGLKTFDAIQGTGHDGTIKLVKKGAEYPTTAKSAETFPKYEAIIPTSEPVLTIVLKQNHLQDIVEAFKDCRNIKLEFHGEHKQVIFTAKGIRAVLMPIHP